jgi:hypothetical protein
LVIGDFANRQQSRPEQVGAGAAEHRPFQGLEPAIWPSVCPLLQRSITALRTASIIKVLAKLTTAGMAQPLASSSQRSRSFRYVLAAGFESGWPDGV